MSLNDDERKTMVGLQMEKANCLFSISEEELKTIVAPAQELVKVISELIGYSKEDNVEP